MNDWKQVKLGDICTLNYGKSLVASKRVTGSVPVYSSAGIIDWHNEALIDGQGIIVGRKGTVGSVYLSTTPFFCIDTAYYILPDETKYNLYYLYYRLKSLGLETLNEDSAVPGLNRETAYAQKFLLPPINIQCKIGKFLKRFEDKIRVNQRINDNLQKIAFLLFERLISVASVHKIQVEDVTFLNPKRQLRKGVLAKYIDMMQLSTTESVPHNWNIRSFNGGMRFTNGDTLMARITPCLENGKAAFVNFLSPGEIAFGSTEYIVLSPKNANYTEFLYCLVRYEPFVQYAVKNMNGSSGRQRVSAETIGKFRIPVISNELMDKFHSKTSILFSKIRENFFENQRLAELRDALLPRLMSGELDVSEVEI